MKWILGLIGAVGALAAPVALAQTTAVAPPQAGGWRITPYTSGVAAGHPGIDQFTGSFDVTKGGAAVTDLKGTSQKDVNNGCSPGVSVKMSGRAPIKHFTQSGNNFYWVGTGRENWETLKFTFQAKHSKKVQKGKGKLRIYFPGEANAIIGGNGGIGSLQFDNNTIGLCNLNFDVK
jgi:hypothetical protein